MLSISTEARLALSTRNESVRFAANLRTEFRKRVFRDLIEDWGQAIQAGSPDRCSRFPRQLVGRARLDFLWADSQPGSTDGATPSEAPGEDTADSADEFFSAITRDGIIDERSDVSVLH